MRFTGGIFFKPFERRFVSKWLVVSLEFSLRLSVITQIGGFYMQIKKGGDWIMAFNEELDILLKDLTEEANNFKEAENPGEEKEALKDMLDIFMRGTQSVREHIDRYNERRWNR